MKDSLGDRMKEQYENRTRLYLPRRTFTIVRVDGRTFHAYTRGCARPYDLDLMADMDAAALALCQQVEGAKFAYVQSDEISLLLTDFESNQAQAWFDGNIQKIASLTASIATAAFNLARLRRLPGLPASPREMAVFDSRAFTIPDRVEVMNYFVWRQQDATRNSISMAAQSLFTHEELQGASSASLQEMMWSRRGVNWNDYPAGFKRGRAVIRTAQVADVEYTDKRTGEHHVVYGVERHAWEVVAPPIITKEWDWLSERVPNYPAVVE